MLRLLCTLATVGTAATAGALPEGVNPILPFDAGGRDAQWLISDWPAGQSAIAAWSADNVRENPDQGTLDLVLNDAGEGDRRFLGAEFQSRAAASTGTWRWVATAPEMVDGAVFGMFLYRADHEADPWREYDFEFVGADTTQVQLNVHFEDPEGRHVALSDARGGPAIVELGFDAAEAPHLYEIEVEEQRAVFRIDGRIVGDFGPEDMPNGIWSSGPLRSFVDLWPAPPELSDWTGTWRYPGRPLVAHIHAVGLPEGAEPE